MPTAAESPKSKLDDLSTLAELAKNELAAINPESTIIRRVISMLELPQYMSISIKEEFKEIMAYPEFDVPMYKPLVDISPELLLPNINFVEQNSVSMLMTNQRFIESYMVGLNHEFGRELLWREFPTDQRGSYFRQFWDVSSFLDMTSKDYKERREKLRDIPPLHEWLPTSELGSHDNREEGPANKENVVLVIRGELLQKYPTATIYVQHALWGVDKTAARELDELTDAEAKELEKEKPIGTEATELLKKKVRFPLYQAKVEPDIYFLGFDLTVKEACAETDNPDDAGWFFVIRERPGEPRFGMDIGDQESASVLHSWSDLSWKDFPDPYIRISGKWPKLNEPKNKDKDTPEYHQWSEDMNVVWDGNLNSAYLAYILYQYPFMVAVHASELLPR